jgi:pSer/pThr/pTyr-binding forkhead associated (FHA) protein
MGNRYIPPVFQGASRGGAWLSAVLALLPAVAVASPWSGAGVFPAEILLLVLFSVLLVAGLISWFVTRSRRNRPYGFLYTRSNGAWVKYPLVSGVAGIGRASGNEVALADRSLSRYHAEIVRHANGTFTINDLGSKNGMRARFHPAKTAPLADGDLIELGPVRFRFVLAPVDERILQDTQTLESHRLWPERERRHKPRVATHARALLFDADAGCVDGEVADVSDGGMYVKTENPPAMHTPVRVAIELEKGHWHTLQGEVARQSAAGVGIHVTEADADTVEKLERLKRTGAAPESADAGPADQVRSAEVIPLKKAG